MDVVYLVAGILLLYVGGESLVKGAASFAYHLGCPPVVIGLTIVSIATSMPELVVSVQANLMDKGDIAIGNVIGSNIANIGLILGTAALIRPISISKKAARIDSIIMILASIYVIYLVSIGYVSHKTGALFLGLAVSYTLFSLFKRKSKPSEQEEIPVAKNIFIDIFLVALGFVTLIFGGHYFLKGAVLIAQQFGVSDAVIGLSLVSIGTSLPELSTTIVASLRRHSDIAIGNVIGSNIFNIFGILGTSSLVKPLVIQNLQQTNCFVLLGFSVALVFFIFDKSKVTRIEGGILLLCFFSYMLFLFTVAG